MIRTLLFATSAAALAMAGPAHAAGFYLQEQSVKGAGRAYSGEVADQGVSSLWWNPAAIARSGREAYVGVHAVFVDATVDTDLVGGLYVKIGDEVIDATIDRRLAEAGRVLGKV